MYGEFVVEKKRPMKPYFPKSDINQFKKDGT